MPSHLETLIEQSADQNRFHKTSRYHGVPILQTVDSNGRATVYAARRFIPEIDTTDAQLHTITVGERPDHVAHTYFGDSERYWDLCDYNLQLRPWTLTAIPGDVIFIPTDSATSGSKPAFFAI